MSCGCKTSGDSSHSCGTKSASGCSSVDTCGNSYKLSVFDWLSHVQNPSAADQGYVEVRFKNDRKFFFKNANNLPLHIGSVVTLEGNPGHDIGVVSLIGELVKIQMRKKNVSEEGLLKIFRLATQKDIETWQELRNKENSVKVQARKIAYALNLEMKITDVEYQGDGSKVTFYYTADNRVDFRQLIKEFAGTFRTKIDMKQIGFRQESAKVGGIGSCGRELCCSTWLTDFRSVNTNAARYQQLSINPQKLAGQCGKLKCCLNYELDSYVDVLRDFPPSSTVLNTEKGKAFCIKIDVFKKRMWFTYVDNSMAWYDIDIYDVRDMVELNKKGKPAPALEDVKVPTAPTMKVDLIQENSVDRFEKKARANRANNKPRTDKKSKPSNPNQQNTAPNNKEAKPTQGQKPRFNKEDRRLKTETKPNASTENKPAIAPEDNSGAPKKAKKPFKKFVKKPNNNNANPNNNKDKNA